MPMIVFDCLVPVTTRDEVGRRFAHAVDTLNGRGKLVGGSVTVTADPPVQPGLEDQLHEIYRSEHEDHDLEQASVVRYTISAKDCPGSVNEVAMVLSHVMTPVCDLPRDSVFLEMDRNYEIPAIYPWSVLVLR